MLKSRIPTPVKDFLKTEAGLFTIQLMMFVPIVGIGAGIVLPSM